MINFKSYKSKYIAILIIIFIAGFVPFLRIFYNSSLSTSISDWGSFGSYLSGVIAIINIVIFVYISFLLIEFDNKRNESQIKAQYKITITQFRQNELDKLNTRLDVISELNDTQNKEDSKKKFANISIYLTNFKLQKSYLFPIIEEYKTKTIIENIENKIEQFIGIIDEVHGTVDIEESKQKKINTKFEFLLISKTQLIDELQKFILNDINK